MLINSRLSKILKISKLKVNNNSKILRANNLCSKIRGVSKIKVHQLEIAYLEINLSKMLGNKSLKITNSQLKIKMQDKTSKNREVLPIFLEIILLVIQLQHNNSNNNLQLKQVVLILTTLKKMIRQHLLRQEV